MVVKTRRRPKRTEPQPPIIVDSFAGGGGASLGIELAMGHSPHIAINHDYEAITMHAANHPDTFHYTEDVFHVDPYFATAGRRVQLMWASPDCKTFSRAKGAKPVEKKIRMLAWVIVKWAKMVHPDVIMLENVSEFQEWGPLTVLRNKRGKPILDKLGKEQLVPIPKRKGEIFQRWWKNLEDLGYKLEKRVLNAADYGVPTSRKRLFVIARRDGKPIVWPQPTHCKPDKDGRVPEGMLPWRTARRTRRLCLRTPQSIGTLKRGMTKCSERLTMINPIELRDALYGCAAVLGATTPNCPEVLGATRLIDDFDASRRILSTLTRREVDMLRGLVAGLSNKELGLQLGISIETVKEYMSNLLQKLELDSRIKAAVLGTRCGLTPLGT